MGSHLTRGQHVAVEEVLDLATARLEEMSTLRARVAELEAERASNNMYIEELLKGNDWLKAENRQLKTRVRDLNDAANDSYSSTWVPRLP